MDAQPAETLLFEATVKPHRSLSRKGVFIAIAFMLSCSLCVTSLMFLLGAWPVIGFNGADIALALFLLWLNIRAGRAAEVITLTGSTLRIARTDLRDLAAALTRALHRCRNPRFDNPQLL
jgi:uncharacterized membrane protein